ncbi:MAG: hypothetical protein K2Z81_09550, partial [Cyanobacteria bacterium]|nr:hypothetical protein [Cyanobacteriota bacterium]
MQINQADETSNWFDQSERIIESVGASTLNLLDISGVTRSARDSMLSPQNWVDLFHAESWRTRQYASKQLEKAGANALPVLIKNMATSNDVEVRDRCQQVLSKYSRIFTDTMPLSPMDCIDYLANLPESTRTDQALRKALNEFSDASVPAKEKRAIDKFFSRPHDDRESMSSNSARLYFLKCLLADPERQYMRILTSPERSTQLSVSGKTSELIIALKTFPEIYKRDGFILRLTSMNSIDEMKGDDATHLTSVEKKVLSSMKKEHATQLERKLHQHKLFERGKDYEDFRKDYKNYSETDNSDRLLMRLRAKPQLLEQPLVLLTLRQHDELQEKIGRGLT